MPDFAYTARDSTGNKVSGAISAATERDALSQLAAQALFPLAVQPATHRESVSTKLQRRRRVAGQTMAVFYSQLAALLRSGVPLLRSLKVLGEQSTNALLQEVLADVTSRVEDGVALGEAMARYPRVFNEMAVNMVRAGSEGGFLEDALERVGQFTEQQEDLKSRTVGALAYPIILSIVGFTVVTGLIVFAVPRFGVIFERLREQGELPWLTDALLGTSEWLQGWWWAVAIAIVAGVLYWRRQMETEAGRLRWDSWKLMIPVAGDIFLNFAVARFCRVLGTLLTNGVTILKALEISRAAAGNRVLAEAIAEATENITAGQSLAQPLSASGKFPRNVVEMIAVAEQSNTLDRVLVEISDALERRTTRRLDLFVRLLEPLMLIVMAGVVLVVVIALLMPIIKMSTAIN